MNELIQYVKNNRNKGDHRGVVVATAQGIGWSFCNTKAGDRFDKSSGVKIALDRVKFGNPSKKPLTVPHAVVPILRKMEARRLAYFRLSQ